MLMNELIRDVDDILFDVQYARTSKSTLDIPLDQVMADMEVILGEIIVNLSKFKDNNKIAGKRVRKYTLALTTLGATFRKLSV